MDEKKRADRASASKQEKRSLVQNLITKINPAPAPPAPEIDIRVFAGVPNAPASTTITVTVTWDAAVMFFGRVISPVERFEVTNATCKWTGYPVPTPFRLELHRNPGNTSPTEVAAQAVGSGPVSNDVWAVPEVWP